MSRLSSVEAVEVHKCRLSRDEAVEARDSYAFTQLNRDGAIGKIDLSDFTELDGGVRLLLQDHPRGR